MPIYEYICCECQEKEEVIQKVSDDAPEKCSKCGAHGTLTKAVSSSSFHLKGGGWYKDAYSTSPPPADKSSAKAKGKGKGKGKAKPKEVKNK